MEDGEFWEEEHPQTRFSMSAKTNRIQISVSSNDCQLQLNEIAVKVWKLILHSKSEIRTYIGYNLVLKWFSLTIYLNIFRLVKNAIL